MEPIDLTDSPPPEQTSGPSAADPNILGTRCDDSRHGVLPMTAEAPHKGCPGWWGRHIHDQDALTCGCSCHREKYGWPHWEQAVARAEHATTA